LDQSIGINQTKTQSPIFPTLISDWEYNFTFYSEFLKRIFLNSSTFKILILNNKYQILNVVPIAIGSKRRVPLVFNIYHLFFFISFFSFTSKVSSQTYPVQTFVQVSPPHTSYLPDYSDPFSNQMKIFLTLTDFTVPSYQVKLKFTLTGNGYSITTSSLLNLPTTTLSPGSPVEISGSDLAPYLSSQNLLFSGIDVADYEIRKVLPEGPCQICVEVIDFSNPNSTL
jgi:hypothetical protein